jgi:hypothetical protein
MKKSEKVLRPVHSSLFKNNAIPAEAQVLEKRRQILGVADRKTVAASYV